MTTKERIAYNKYVNESLKQRDYLLSAEEKCKEEGIEKGRKEGEENNAIATAKKMLAKRKPINEIIEFTGLTIEKIEQLKKEIEVLKEK
ncbi:transposase [Orientia tsutsugamushi str. Ikeda]|nr:transposase [Orientia tsutsugamushi str. Ikeda]